MKKDLIFSDTEKGKFVKELFEVMEGDYYNFPEEAEAIMNKIESYMLSKIPDPDAAGVIALDIASHADPKLNEIQQVFFIAGFTECVKYIKQSIQK